jgi:hypothetical protein
MALSEPISQEVFILSSALKESESEALRLNNGTVQGDYLICGGLEAVSYKSSDFRLPTSDQEKIFYKKNSPPIK